MKENIFENKTIQIKKFQDLRGLDLSSKDLRNIPVNVLITASFDTTTKWPSSEKLPESFSPETVLENNKNPGLGLKEIHEQGFTGKGINVAIIDQKLDLNHQEYSDNIIDCEEFGELGKEDISMHGPGVTSLFVGKNCGVAPEAKLHYKAVPSGDYSSWEFYSEALDKIIRYNNTASYENKVKVVSCSNGYPNPGIVNGNLEDWEKTIKKAKESGIIFIDANTFFNLNFVGGGSSEKEDVEKYNLWLAIDENIDVFDKINPSWNYKDRIIIPSDYRTIASSWNKENEYSFYGIGGISWSIPYLAGIFSLMLQVNKNLKMEEMVKVIHETASVNEKGLKIINPKGIIELVKSKKRND